MSQYELGTNISIDPADAAADCALAASIGLKWVRTSQEMQWTSDYSIGRLQAFAEAAADNGLKLIQCCQGLTAAISKTGTAGHFGPKDANAAAQWGAWAALCSEVVQSICGGVVTLGNEWDNYGWTGTPNSADAAALITAALDARDALGLNVPMGTPELAPGSNPDQLLFFEDLCKKAPKILTDPKIWIGWHPYTDLRWPAYNTESWSAIWKLHNADKYVHAATGKHKKFVCGEWGLADGPSDWSQRLDPVPLANYVQKSYLPAFDRLQAQGIHIGPLVWYTLRDGAAGDGSWADHCGLFDIHGNAKPVAYVIAAAAAA